MLLEPGVDMHACNSSTWEAEERGSCIWVPIGLNNEILFQKKDYLGWQTSSSCKSTCLASVKSWVQTPLLQKKKIVIFFKRKENYLTLR
jgi:hypothetical protein